MRLRTHLPTFAAGLLTCLCFLSVAPICGAGDNSTPQAIPDTNASPAGVSVDEVLRQLKEQQASAAQALELILDHTETALHRNALAVSNQLAQFSVALADYSDRQFQLMRSTESRTLRVSLLILLVVVLMVAVLLLLAARALRTLAHRFSGAASPFGVEPPPGAHPLLEPAADSAYTTAMLDVEKRIAALEHRQTHALAATGEASSPALPTRAAPRPGSSAKLKSSAPLAMALGSGEALMFLPRDRSPHADNRVVSALGRIGRLFQRATPVPRVSSGPKPPKG